MAGRERSIDRALKHAIWAVPLSLAAIAFLVWLFWPLHKPLKVESFSWKRWVDVEQLNTVVETRGHLPSEGRLLRRWTETHFVSLPDGDGGMTTHVEFETRYRYEIERWQFHQRYDASGNGRDPRWPEYGLAKASLPHGAGEQRVHYRGEKYTIHFRDKERQYWLDVPQEKWRSLEIGEVVDATILRMGSIIYFRRLESG
jgi:hypothetical protein